MRTLEVVAEVALGRFGVHGMSVVRISAAPAREADAALPVMQDRPRHLFAPRASH